MKLRALIVDDETIARRHLMKQLGAYHEEITVVGEAANGLEAIKEIERLTPDLLFLDIEMPTMNGFEVLHRVTWQPLTVFTTAHEEYALSAFKETTLDYLLKPIGAEGLERAVRKLRRLVHRPVGNPQDAGTASTSPASAPSVSYILARVGYSLKVVPVEKIVYLEANDKITTIHTVNGAYEIETSLSELESRLPPRQFLRIHRRHIVNVAFVSEMQKWGNRGLRMLLDGPAKTALLVSRRCLKNVERRFGFGCSGTRS